MKSLVRWQPMQECTSLQRPMNRFFDNLFGRTTSLMPFQENLSDWGFGPPVDIYEDDQSLTFKVEVPGIDEKDIKVEVENNVLTVHGERKLEKDIKEENFRRMERHYGAFSRSFMLPQHGGPREDRSQLFTRCFGHPDAETCRGQAKTNQGNRA